VRSRSRTAPLRLSLLALSTALLAMSACSREPEPRPLPVPPAPGPSLKPAAPVAANALRSPKPGERVRQPELDGYCDGDVALAFYYHGGNATTRVARNDHCTPLFLSECEAEGRCYPPRDQEPGMWCCAPRSDETAPAIHAAR
jgi:hypothetical protein